MHPTHPASDLWDWPVSRPGRWAMGMLGTSMIMLVLSPPLMWLIGRHEDEILLSMWYFLPFLITISLAVFSGLLAVVAITVMRERSVFLWFAILGGLFALMLMVEFGTG